MNIHMVLTMIGISAMAAAIYELTRILIKLFTRDYISRKKVQDFVNIEVSKRNLLIETRCLHGFDKEKVHQEIQALLDVEEYVNSI